MGKQENIEHVRYIAECIEAVNEGRMFRNEDGDICTADTDSDVPEDADVLTMLDYFEDVLDIVHYVGGRNDYRGVRLMVACGGPNIYVDSMRGTVELYWWGESATWDISYSAREDITDTFREYFECCY